MHDITVNLLSGAVGGFCNVVVGHPFDTVKSMLQIHRQKSFLRCFITTFKNRGLYAGSAPSFVSNISENTILFSSYSSIVDCVNIENKNVKSMICSSISSVITSFVICPLEQIKIKAQLTNRSSISIAGEIFKSGRFFNGIRATVIREVPGNIAFFGTYEYCRTLFDVNETIDTILSGGFAGVAFWMVSLPSDNVKTQQQFFGLRFGQALELVYKQRAFYRGLLPAILRSFPCNAALFLGVENTKNLLKN